jgi:GTP-binding protein
MLKIWLVGPTNAGKSLLFNFLLGTHRAIVTDLPGTTRELLRDKTTIARLPVEIIDSPGLLDFADELQFLAQVIEDSDLLLFVVDGKQEMGRKEQEIHQMICKSGKFDRTILVVNKLDGKVYTPEREWLLAHWYVLGYERMCGISAEQHEGMEFLKEEVHLLMQDTKQIMTLPPEQTREEEEFDEKLIHLAIIGRPNAGKSTLLNKLIWEEISHVSEQPGTTLDYLIAQFSRKQHTIQLYDTAGIRKKWKTVGLERIAYAKTKSLMEYRHPITIVLIDFSL